MTVWPVGALCGLAAYLAAVGLMPPAIWLAPRIGAVDVPRDGRRLHTRPIPRSGGIALFGAFLLGCTATGASASYLMALLCGATLLVLLGIFDDIYQLSAGLKLAVQTVAAATVLGGGLAGEGAWRYPVALLWLLLLINAHNMIDGLDGLLGSVGAIESGALALVFWVQGRAEMAALALTLGGALGGFLRYNRHPARVFMGDAGSQTVGLLLGALSLHIDPASAGTLGRLIAPFVFAYPLSDLGFAVIRRLSRGQSPFAADRGHWHHRLVDAGMGQEAACVCLAAGAALPAGIGVLLIREDFYPWAVYLSLAAAALLVLADQLRPHRGNRAK